MKSDSHFPWSSFGTAARAVRETSWGRAASFRKWSEREWAMPAPKAVKRAVLSRYGHLSGTWVETGTYYGDTTAFLAKTGQHVFSIEPSPELARIAVERFKGFHNVTILEGLSENRLPQLLGEISGPVSFWLDGHFSAGVTFQGPRDTPIREELAAIEAHLSRLGTAVILVDDVRCFEPSNPDFLGYPSRGWLVGWAERNSLVWTIEHDIFVAWN